MRVINNNTKQQFMPLTNDYLVICIKILHHNGLTKKFCINVDGNILEFKSFIPFFHPYPHVSPTDQTNDISISPVE